MIFSSLHLQQYLDKEDDMDYNYLNDVKFFLDGLEIIGFSSGDPIFLDELYKVPPASDKITSILGNVKGVVSSEDRQLLKIVHNLSEKDVDKLISDYKIEYNNHLKSSRPWGKEKWR